MYKRTLIMIPIFMMFFCFQSLAGWKQDHLGWWYESVDGDYIKDGWEWIDDDSNGTAKCYYFREDGYLVQGQTVDGAQVNENGEWTLNGTVQELLILDKNGWQEINGSKVFVQNNIILKDCITPDNVYVGPEGYPVKSGIDPSLMQEKSSVSRYIAVSKSTHTLELWDKGNMVERFTVNTGKISGDKEVEGDKKTPEGEYYICKKIPNSNYHLALGISYPMIEDAERGLRQGLINHRQYMQIEQAILNGLTPDWHTQLGGYIEIHGCRTSRMTSGCISMRDEDIDKLYHLVEVGDRIVIFP